jgi:Flp pilus assembly protein TadD
LEEERRLVQSQTDRALKAAREEIRLGPRNVFADAALGLLEEGRGNWAASEDAIRQAISLDQNDPDIRCSYISLLSTTGRLK